MRELWDKMSTAKAKRESRAQKLISPQLKSFGEQHVEVVHLEEPCAGNRPARKPAGFIVNTLRATSAALDVNVSTLHNP